MYLACTNILLTILPSLLNEETLMSSHGRLTLPTEVGAERESIGLIGRLGAYAIRNSDGTELPPDAASMVDKVYATYFVARGDQEWAESHTDELQQL